MRGTFRSGLCLVLFAFTAFGCQNEQLSQDSLAEDLKAVYDDEESGQSSLITTAKNAWNQVADATLGSPVEIADAKAALKKITDEKEAKRKEINAPVDAAQEALNTANEAADAFKGKAHYGNGRVWCGSDGCSAYCSDECSHDKVCFEDICRCVPQCTGRECGKDGCGGVCGEHKGGCGEDQWCNEDYQCVPHSYTKRECEPSCRLGGQPSRSEGKDQNKVKGERRMSSYDKKVNHPNFQDLDALSSYIDTLNKRADQLKAEQAAHIARAAQIIADDAALSAMDISLTAAEDLLKAMKDAIKKGTPDGSPPPTEADVETHKASVSDLKAKKKAMKAALKALKKAHKAADKMMKKYAESEARIRSESARLTPIAAAWKQALDAVAAAQAKVDEAEAAAKGPLAALDAEYADDIADAQKNVDQLEAAAFSADLKAIWSCAGPTCPTQSAYIRNTDELSLSPLSSAVADLYESRRDGWLKHQAALREQDEKTNEMSEDAEAEGGGDLAETLPEYEDWGTLVEQLRDCSVYLEELEASNERKVALLEALHSARSSMGK